MTFAEALIKVKKQECMKEVEVNEAARRTAAGFLLLQFGNNTKPEKISAIRTKIAAAMGEGISVQASTKKISVQVNDIDPITTMEEVQEAVAEMIPGEEYGGMQRTIVTFNDTPAARKMLERGRLRIGFVSCRLKILPVVTRCYRCHNLGHTAARCTLEKTIKEVCKKCGERHHAINECTRPARCCASTMGATRKSGTRSRLNRLSCNANIPGG